MTTLVVVGAYLSVSPTLLMGLLPAAVFGLLFARGGPLAWMGAALCVGVSGLLLASGASYGVWLGLGGALGAIALARHFVNEDHAFDNFDRLLAVCAVASCWSALGAWVTLGIVEEGSSNVPFSALGAALVGPSLAAVVITGDVRRLRWLRGVRTGQIAGYALKSARESDDCRDLPALMGGFMPLKSVLVMSQALSTSAFRGGWRETAIARAPSDLVHVARAVWVRLIATALVTLVDFWLAARIVTA